MLFNLDKTTHPCTQPPLKRLSPAPLPPALSLAHYFPAKFLTFPYFEAILDWRCIALRGRLVAGFYRILALMSPGARFNPARTMIAHNDRKIRAIGGNLDFVLCKRHVNKTDSKLDGDLTVTQKYVVGEKEGG